MMVAIDVINWSVTLVLYNSVASGNSEIGLTVLSIEWLHLLWLDRQFGIDFLLLLLVLEFVKYLRLLHFSVIKEQVKSRLADWDYVFHNIPQNTFREWCSCQRASVSPSAVVPQLLNELGQVELLFGLTFDTLH